MKRLAERSGFFVPSDVERRSAAAIRAVLDDDEDDTEASTHKEGADREEEASYVVDLGNRPDPSTASATKPATVFWTRLQTGWAAVEDRLAGWFGLEQSKYQWAVDELLERELAGDHPAPKASVNGLQMQNLQEQSMQRIGEIKTIG